MPLKMARRWARAYDACQACGGTERPHVASGYCSRCYYPWLYANSESRRAYNAALREKNREHFLAYDRARNQNPGRKKYHIANRAVRRAESAMFPVGAQVLYYPREDRKSLHLETADRKIFGGEVRPAICRGTILQTSPASVLVRFSTFEEWIHRKWLEIARRPSTPLRKAIYE